MFTSSSPSRFLNSRIFLDADNGAGGGTPDPADDQAKPKQSDIDAAVSKRIADLLGVGSVNNDPMAALTISIKAQHRLEQEVQRLKTQVAQQPQVPAELQTKLTAYEALGTPEELSTKLQAGEQAITANQTRIKTDARNAAYSAAGYDPDKVSALAFVDEYDYETKTEKVDGKDVQVSYAKRTINGAEEVKKVSEVLAERAGALEPALKAGQQAGRVQAPVMGVSTNTMSVNDRIRAERRAEIDKTKTVNSDFDPKRVGLS